MYGLKLRELKFWILQIIMVNKMATKNQYTPRKVSHPGVTLGAKIQEMEMSVREFAVRTAKPEKTILAVLRGDSSITPDMAVIFENVTRIPAHFWMSRQRIYDEFMARQRMLQKYEDSADWVNRFPIEQMSKYGWLPPVDDMTSKTKALLQFFAVTSPEAWENYYMNQQLKVAFRISLRSTIEPYAISAWLRQGDRQAESINLTEEYSDKKLREQIPVMKSLMVDMPQDWTTELCKICSACGVKLVYSPTLPKAPINGATRWIASKYPCIQISSGEKRYDIFWFTFFHEIGHILLHGKKDFFLENVDYDNKEVIKENEADEFAANILLTRQEEEKIIEEGDYSIQSIKSFAEKFGTHPSVIVGRLHHRRLIPKTADVELLQLIE